MTTQAEGTCNKFEKAFTNFSKCHCGYSGGAMTTQLIDQLGGLFILLVYLLHLSSSCTEKDIETFMSHYRESFPHATILPKMHILEDHVIPWLRKWRVGAGLMGEQGAESLHAHLHKLERDYSGIPNKLDRLKYIFKMYNIETAPSLLELRPEIKRRKKRKLSEN